MQEKSNQGVEGAEKAASPVDIARTPGRGKSRDKDIKVLLEFMRIKAPELHIRQVQLSRIVLPYFILNIVLFLIMFRPDGSVSFDLVESFNIQSLVTVVRPRPYLLVGALIVIFFYFMRFGYLFYQGAKDIVSVQNLIDGVLPYNETHTGRDGDRLNTRAMRESLIQTCKANYFVQSIVVFFYPIKSDASIKSKSAAAIGDGPLAGAGFVGVMAIRVLMVLMIVCFVWFIAVSQFMMIVGFLWFFKLFVCFLVFGAFVSYYCFFLHLIWMTKPKKERDWSAPILATMFTAFILYSVWANLALFSNYYKVPDITGCRITLDKIEELSPPAKYGMSILFTVLGTDKPGGSGDQQGGIPRC